MKFFDIYNRFWRMQSKLRMTTAEIALFEYILNHFNYSRWPASLSLSNPIVQHRLNISRKTLINARNRLHELRLIRFRKGNARVAPVYCLVLPGEDGWEVSEDPAIPQAEKNSTPNVMAADAEHVAYHTAATVSDQVAHQESGHAADNLADHLSENLPRQVDSGGSNSIQTERMAPRRLPEAGSGISKSKVYNVSSSEKSAVRKDLNASALTNEDSPNYLEEVRRRYEESSDRSFRSYCLWVAKNARYLAQRMPPLTEEEYGLLRRKFGEECVTRNLRDLNNDLHHRDRYASLYPALCKWCALDRQRTR